MPEVGRFSSDHKAYTITEMFPPRPLYNYLWNERFIADINHFGCGPSWNRIGAVHSGAVGEGDSRLFFIREQDTGEFWSANRNFSRMPFDEHSCEVGLGYSIVRSKHRDVSFSFRMFIPPEGNCECWSVTVRNDSSTEKALSLFSYSTSDINLNEHEAYNHASYIEELRGILISSNSYDVEKTLLHHYAACDVAPTAYETTDRRFKGVYGAITSPDAVTSGRLASTDTSFDNEMIHAFQHDMQLAPGESRVLNFMNGLATSPDEAIEIVESALSDERFEAELSLVQKRAAAHIDKVSVHTPDEDVNAFANIWLKRQIDLGKTWARTYTRGFRDIMQDTTAFVSLDPTIAAEKIAYCLAYQFPSGNTLRQWEPVLEHPYVDGAAWLIPAVCTYVKETGGVSFLDANAPYYQCEETGTVLDHCRRGMHFLLTTLGKHGLCLWGGGDWNDSMNGAGLQGIGESVWLSQSTVVAAREFAKLLELLGEAREASQISAAADELVMNLREHAWDTDHFICGFTDWGETVGSYENAEAKIFLNMQTWGVLSGAAPDAGALMDLVERELLCPWGYVLNKPSFSRGDNHIGRASFFEKGCYENGSVYNHGGAFKIAADCILGRGEYAYRTLKMMLPTNPANPSETSGCEPYAITNMYLGPENDLRAGKALMHWITGTAGWLYRCIVEYMVGLQAEYDGLTLRPVLNKRWTNVKAKRLYRGSVYEIAIHNPDGLETGQLSVNVDGARIEGATLPVFDDGLTHSVEVVVKLRSTNGGVLIAHAPHLS